MKGEMLCKNTYPSNIIGYAVQPSMENRRKSILKDSSQEMLQIILNQSASDS